MARIDLPAASGTRQNPGRVKRLLASLGRNTCSTASLRTLARDVAGDPPLSWAATANYLDALERVFLVEYLPVWSARLRSRATLQQSPKRHFADASLAAAVLGATPSRLLDGRGGLPQQPYNGHLLQSTKRQIRTQIQIRTTRQIRTNTRTAIR